MSSFVRLDWPRFDFEEAMVGLLETGKVSWVDTQICLTTTIDRQDDYTYGCGSLYWDWSNRSVTTGAGGTDQVDVPVRNPVLYEKDFTTLCDMFVDTPFEDAYYWMSRYFVIGRLRLMKLRPRTCLTWHVDDQPRIHYPITTQDGAFMVIENQSKHLEPDTWWYTQTTLPHTAFNGSSSDRVHLVACILSQR